MLKIAITGNIASGKSQVESYLDKLGYSVYDSDKIAHEVLNTLDSFYGYDVFTNGKIDRKKLAALVFNDNVIKEKLEKLTHPKIKSKIIELFNLHANDKYIFVSVPLLYEAGFDDIFDIVLLITIDSDTQLKRLIARNNLSEREALARINSQLSQEEKINKADYIISNDGSFEDLEKQLQSFLNKINTK